MNIKKESTKSPQDDPVGKSQPTQPPKTGESVDVVQDSAREADAPHKAFEDAYEQFFRDLCAVTEESQRRLVDAQFEYQRALQEAWRSQDEKMFQEAVDKFQQAMEAAGNDTSYMERYAEVYERYQTAVRKAFASTKGEEFDPMTLSAIAQSMSIVAQAASQLPRPPQNG